MTEPQNTGTAKSRYQKMVSIREPYLTRARDASLLTIPSLLPPDGHTGDTKLYTPWQGMGARCVNSMASKFLLSQLPPNSPFFRFMIDEGVVTEEADDAKLKAQVEKDLSRGEKMIMREVEMIGLRTPTHEAFKHLIVAGNALLTIPEDDSPRVFHLDRYVVRRSPAGEMLEAIVCEDVDTDALPQAVQEALDAAGSNGVKAEKSLDPSGDASADSGTGLPTRTIEMYTRLYLDNDSGMYRINQEVGGVDIAESHGSYPKDKCPWLALRLIRIDGEDYGRGYVEEYIGDLSSLESLTQTVVEGSAIAAKILFGVKPGSTTRAKDMDATNGSIIEGADFDADVTVLRVEKHNDLKVVQELLTVITERLGYAFLLHQSVQRNAERVTAAEIRIMVQDLDKVHSGMHALLSQEYQLPIVRIILAKLVKQKKFPEFPNGFIRPAIVTGLEAIGRTSDAEKLRGYVQAIGEDLGKEAVERYIDVTDYCTQLATGMGLDGYEGLVKSPERIAEEDASNQKNQVGSQMIDKLGPGAMGIAKDAVNVAMNEQPMETTE